MPFNQQMTVPVNLSLHRLNGEFYMEADPIKELESLRETKAAFMVPEKENRAVTKPTVLAGDLDAFDMEIAIDPNKSDGYTLDLRGTKLVYDVKKATLTCKDVTMPVKIDHRTLFLRILVDRGSVEVFADFRRLAMSVAAIPDEKNRNLELIPNGGDLTIKYAVVYRMKSAWEK